MAATVTDQHALLPGDNRVGIIATVTGDSSYTTGGYAVTPTQFGLTTIYAMVAAGMSNGRYAQYDATTGKVVFYERATGAETTAATNVTTNVIPVIVYGV